MIAVNTDPETCEPAMPGVNVVSFLSVPGGTVPTTALGARVPEAVSAT